MDDRKLISAVANLKAGETIMFKCTDSLYVTVKAIEWDKDTYDVCYYDMNNELAKKRDTRDVAYGLVHLCSILERNGYGE